MTEQDQPANQGEQEFVPAFQPSPEAVEVAMPKAVDFAERAQQSLDFGPYVEKPMAASRTETFVSQVEAFARTDGVETRASLSGKFTDVDLMGQYGELVTLWQAAESVQDPAEKAKARKNALLRIPSANGLRSGFAKLLESPVYSESLIDVLKGRAEALEASEAEQREVGGETLDAAGIKEPFPDVMQAGKDASRFAVEGAAPEHALPTELEQLQAQEEAIHQELLAMVEHLPERERIGVWQHATARFQPERDSAADKMGDSKEALAVKWAYKDKFDDLQRVRARIDEVKKVA